MAGSAAGPATGPCPATGAWALCSAIKRLEASGLAPRPDSANGAAATHVDGLAQDGVRYLVGDAELDLFFYPDSTARKAAAARLDRTAFIPYDQPQTMKREPTLIESVNLIAILHSMRDAQRERVADAFLAGPPQPDPTKH